MANGTPPTGTVAIAIDAVKTLGIPAAIAGVLLWFFLVRVDAIIQDIQKTQVRIEDAVGSIHSTQGTIEVQIREWIMRGCPNVPPKATE